MQKCERNDPCSCGSGKKFKKCCEGRSSVKRFQISRLDTQRAESTIGLTALFQQKLTPIVLKPLQLSIETPSLEEKPKDLIT